MHNVTHRSHRMQKHNFGIMCPGVLFVGSEPAPPKHEKYCVNVSRPGRTKTQYVTIDPTVCKKTEVQRNMSQHTFCGVRTGPN
jgi:hypothetical protein